MFIKLLTSVFTMKNKNTLKPLLLFIWNARGNNNLENKSRLCVKWEDDAKEETPPRREVGENEATGQATR